MSVTFDMHEVMDFAVDLRRAGAAAESLARAVVEKSAYDLQAEAQYLAPVDTGFLRSSISTSVAGLEAVVGPTADYGFYVEHGTSRMPGQPFLFPALDRITPTFEAAMGQVLTQVLT